MPESKSQPQDSKPKEQTGNVDKKYTLPEGEENLVHVTISNMQVFKRPAPGRPPQYSSVVRKLPLNTFMKIFGPNLTNDNRFVVETPEELYRVVANITKKEIKERFDDKLAGKSPADRKVIEDEIMNRIKAPAVNGHSQQYLIDFHHVPGLDPAKVKEFPENA